ncbi:hypothetical protein BVC80_9057g84 [Macleaya cordata]|uniref:Uncharacterized protein n=1 Tax=Macleaya cordata TaxID=56857 RepID=A0A200R9V7_MACCD|nr:hypothetical protein BVC80_9057g84 [Macleaya cordata]
MTKDGEVFLHNHIKYEVREKRNLPMWMQGGLDYIMLQHLNIDGIRTIGSVLGLRIALDYYVRQTLYQLVGKANSNLADVRKLGLFERSEIAWTDAKYAQMWEYLGDIFKLTHRFAGLDSKLKLMEEQRTFIKKKQRLYQRG